MNACNIGTTSKKVFDNNKCLSFLFINVMGLRHAHSLKFNEFLEQICENLNKKS